MNDLNVTRRGNDTSNSRLAFIIHKYYIVLVIGYVEIASGTSGLLASVFDVST